MPPVCREECQAQTHTEEIQTNVWWVFGLSPCITCDSSADLAEHQGDIIMRKAVAVIWKTCDANTILKKKKRELTGCVMAWKEALSSSSASSNSFYSTYSMWGCLFRAVVAPIVLLLVLMLHMYTVVHPLLKQRVTPTNGEFMTCPVDTPSYSSCFLTVTTTLLSSCLLIQESNSSP